MVRYRIRDAASLVGVSSDTMRRWVEQGRVAAALDEQGRKVIGGADLAVLAREVAAEAVIPQTDETVAVSSRNRMTGIVTRVVKDTVMAQVDIQAGPHRLVSLMTREAADELKLEPGCLAVAAIKATNVVVELPHKGRN